MKWRETVNADVVPARIDNIKFPEIAIIFYEERLGTVLLKMKKMRSMIQCSFKINVM